MSDYSLGILLTLIGAAINNFGIVIQKARTNRHLSTATLSEYLKDPWWTIGIFMQVMLCLPFFLIALTLIGITILQPLSNAGIIFLVIGLTLFVKEHLTKWEIVGVICLILGMIFLGIGGVIGDITSAVFFQSEFQQTLPIILIIMGFCLGICLIIAKRIEKLRIMMFGFSSGIFYAFVSISMQIFTLVFTMELITLAIVIGMISAFVFVGSTICAIYVTQEAFKRGQAINFIPFAQLTMNLFPIIAGIWVFRQMIVYPIFFWLGLCLIICGASFLARLQK